MIGDRGRLERLLRNLTDNAARHAASEIRLGLRGDDGQVVLEVNDDGPGVPVGKREAVFERFTRLDDAPIASTGEPVSAWPSWPRSRPPTAVRPPSATPHRAAPDSSWSSQRRACDGSSARQAAETNRVIRTASSTISPTSRA